MAGSFTWVAATRGGYWMSPWNWTASGAAPGQKVPGAADQTIVDGGPGTEFGIVAGSGSANELDANGNVAFEGAFGASLLFIGSPTTLTATPKLDNTDAIDIEAGSVVTAGSTGVFSDLEIDGAGARLAANAVNVIAGSTPLQVVLVNRATLQAGALAFSGGQLILDSISAIEAGTAGGAAAGVVTIDAGAQFSLSNGAAIDASVINSGTLAFGAAAGGFVAEVYGSVSGPGTLQVANNGAGTVQTAINGAAQITLGNSSSLTVVTGGITNVGSITTGANAALKVGGSLNHIGAINIGAAATATIGSFGGVGSITAAGPITVGAGATLSITGTLSGSTSLTMGLNSVLNLTGGDPDTPINLGTANDVALNLGAGANIGGAVTGFDNSDLIRSSTTSALPFIVTRAAWANGVLTLSSGDTPITTVALAGTYAGQRFLVNSVGIPINDSDVTLAGPTLAGFGAGAQTRTGSSDRLFTLVTGGGASGALSLAGNFALDGAYTAASLLVADSSASTIDALDIQANSSLAVAGNAAVQSNLELNDTGAKLSVGGTLSIGGDPSYVGEVLVLTGGSLQAANLTITGNSGTYGTIQNNPALAILGGTAEVGTLGTAAANTLQIDPGATLRGATENGRINVKTVVDNGALAVSASPQGLSQLELTGDLTGTGTISTAGTLAVDGSVSGLSSIAIPGGTLNIVGNLTDAIPLEIAGTLQVTGTTTGLTSLTLDPSSTSSSVSAHLTGQVSNVGPVTIGAGSKLTFGAGASGTGAISVGVGADFTPEGILTGWSGISLASNATLDAIGHVEVPVSLTGLDTVNEYDGGDVDGVVSGFDTSDTIRENAGRQFSLGGAVITGATWQQGANGTGTLTLTDDGATLHTLTLAGNYTSTPFITDAIRSVVNGVDDIGQLFGISTVGLAYGSQAGLSGATLTGDTGGSFKLLTGSGNAAALTITNNIAVTGSFTVGALTTAVGDANADNALLVEAGGSIMASTDTLGSSTEIDGGTLRVSGQLLLDNNTGNYNVLLAVNGGRVQAGSLQTAAFYTFDTSYLAVDSTGSIEVGAAGGAVAGAVTVDTGATATIGDFTQIQGNLVLNGVLNDNESLYQYRGNVSGVGVLQVGQSDTYNIASGNIAGLSAVNVTGSLKANAVTGIGALTIGKSGGANIGNLSAGSVTVGDGTAVATLTVNGNASGTGALVINGSSVTVNGATSGFSQIIDGPGSSLTLGGGETGSPIIMQAGSTLAFGQQAPAGIVSGFAVGDALIFAPGAGGTIVTAAQWTAGTGGLGTLTLFSDDQAVGSLTLAGDYSNAQFLTNYAGEPHGETVITLASLPDPLFNAAYYLAQNSDVAAAGIDPYQHYMTVGWKEGRNPSPYFNTNYYEANNPDVKAAGINPLLHFEASGWKEGRNPSAAFDTGDYLAANPDVKAAGIDPLLHYVDSGQAEGRAAFAVPTTPADPLVNAGYIYAERPDVAHAGVDASAWFDSEGWKEGANPNADFDTSYYLAQNPDVRAAGINPLLHFEANGWREGRNPSLLFSDSKYLAANPDVAAAGIDPLQQYLSNGQAEGRAAFLTGGALPADPLVNAAYYDAQLGATLIPSGTAGAQQAAASYDATGWQRGLNPDAFFNTQYYLSHNPDVAAAHIDPLLHYEMSGWKEGRDPSALFSTSKYLAAYADVRAAGVDPLVHYIQNGQAEGRQAFHV